MDADKAKTVAIALRDIRDATGEILQRSPDCGAPAGTIIRAIATIEEAAIGPNQAELAGSRRTNLGQRNKPKRYVRESVGGSEVLAEYRHDSRIPLRSPREMFFGVVEILAKAADPLAFDELQAMLGERFGSEPAGYQARIALRFLTSADVELVTRSKSRYSAVRQGQLKTASQQVWESLPRY